MSLIIQIVFALLLFFFSSAVAWYEGSALLEHPSEWKHSAPFSQMMNEEVVQKGDLYPIDFFVYAAKFQPTFPLLMAISLIYIFVVLAHHYLSGRASSIGFAVLSLILLACAGLIVNSPTEGGQIFTRLFFIVGLLCGAYSFVQAFRIKKQMKAKKAEA
ncbi:YjdJ family protein [Pseudalkalibacillus sp. SCS-8]|uniref:YjdJ family protein n=1 Tax=Pseudalkalibacillus nanhaiensis TaxID=3115291 RepID=UPI0032DB5215